MSSFASNDIFTETLVAGADLRNRQYRYVKFKCRRKSRPM